MSATETLAEARKARGAGDVQRCLLLAAACVQEARDEGDHDTAFLAACTPGALYSYRGEPNDALGHYRYALDVALSHGLTHRLPEVYHDLFAMSKDAGNFERGKRFFTTAMELHLDMNPGNRRITALLADEADGRFTCEPSAETAHDSLEAWRGVPGSLSGAKERFFAGCGVAAVAAWLGEGYAGRYKGALGALEAAFPDLPNHEGVALGFTHAATGAQRAHDFPRALQLADRAIRVATERGESGLLAKARAVRSDVLAEQSRSAYL
jgi:tetratricopeptide (TPR) repeat protein